MLKHFGQLAVCELSSAHISFVTSLVGSYKRTARRAAAPHSLPHLKNVVGAAVDRFRPESIADAHTFFAVASEMMSVVCALAHSCAEGERAERRARDRRRALAAASTGSSYDGAFISFFISAAPLLTDSVPTQALLWKCVPQWLRRSAAWTRYA